MFILTATGEVQRFDMKDIDPTPPRPPVERPPTSTEPIYEVVRTKDGSIYYGELVERVVRDHVTVKLETGATKWLAWEDIDPSPLPLPPLSRRDAAPLETVRTVGGTVVRGELVERVIHDHVTLELANGRLRTIDWSDVVRSPPTSEVRLPRPRPMAQVAFSSRSPRASLQRFVEGRWTAVCNGPCSSRLEERGLYRIAGAGLAPSGAFHLATRNDTIVARLGRRWERDVGWAFTAASIPALIGSTVMVGATLITDGQSGYYYEGGRYHHPDRTPLDVGTTAVCLASAGLLPLGITLVVLAASHVTLDGRRVGRIAPEGIRF